MKISLVLLGMMTVLSTIAHLGNNSMPFWGPGAHRFNADMAFEKRPALYRQPSYNQRPFDMRGFNSYNRYNDYQYRGDRNYADDKLNSIYFGKYRGMRGLVYGDDSDYYGFNG